MKSWHTVVTRVLLSDGWLDVDPRWGLSVNGQEVSDWNNDVATVGPDDNFAYTPPDDDKTYISGPLSSIIAVFSEPVERDDE
jgi:hypothetical protein